MKYKKELIILLSIVLCALTFALSVAIVMSWEDHIQGCSKRTLECMTTVEFLALQIIGIPGALFSVGLVGSVSCLVFYFEKKQLQKQRPLGNATN